MDGSNKIYNFLVENDKNINWEKSFKSLFSIASLCSVTLIRIKFTLVFREEEKKNKSNRKPSREVEKKVDELAARYVDEAKHIISNGCPYYPIIKSNEELFNDEDTIQNIKLMLHKDFALPSTQLENVPEFLFYSLTLMGVFNSLFYNYKNEIPETTTTLIIILNELCYIVPNLFKNLDEIERIGDRKSRVASADRIKDYEKHPEFPILEQMLRAYHGTPKEIRDINELLEKILNTKSRVTIKKYRLSLLKKIKGV